MSLTLVVRYELIVLRDCLQAAIVARISLVMTSQQSCEARVSLQFL